MTDDKFATYLIDLAADVQRYAEDYKVSITPLGSKEQWIAWDCLERAIANLKSAGVYVELHAAKQEAIKNERARSAQRMRERR